MPLKALSRAMAVGGVAILLAACGNGGDTESVDKGSPPTRKVRITLNGYDGAENAGILMAEQRGYFRDAGLKAIVTSPQKQRRSIRYVMHRWVEIGVTHQPQVVLARAKGAPVTAVGSLVSQPMAAMIWLKESGIRGIADLRGKTIAVPGVPFEKSLLASILARGGLTLDDVVVERAGYHLALELETGRADAIFGGSWSIEGVELKSRGFEPVVTRVQDLGVPSYDELVMVARDDLLAEDPELIRDVNAAVARGTAAALAEPSAVVRTIRNSYETYWADDRKTTEAKVNATLPLLSKNGYMDPGQAERLVGWMRSEGMVQSKPPVPDLLTNEYLAEVGR